jgi:hypothetical protein
MIPSRRYAKSKIAAGLAVAFLSAAPVVAQTASAIDPATLDVAGVKLGMTPEEAMVALKQFEPRFVVKKLYTQGQYSNYNVGGGDLALFSEAERAKYYFTGLSAVDEGLIKPETKCRIPTDWQTCVTIVHDDVEKITVGFSPVPGQERVIGVLREKTFNKEPKPAIATLLAGVLAKYPYQSTFQHPISGGSVVGWQFDARKQLMSGATAKIKRVAEVSGELPQRVSPGDGIDLYMSLVDSDALYKSIDQSKGAAAAVRAKVDAAAIEKAKGASQTKF